jgi:hypothetical protein
MEFESEFNFVVVTTVGASVQAPATAAEDGLKPAPASRFRGALPHRLNSYALLGLSAFRAHGTRSPPIRPKLGKNRPLFVQRIPGPVIDSTIRELTPEKTRTRRHFLLGFVRDTHSKGKVNLLG